MALLTGSQYIHSGLGPFDVRCSQIAMINYW